MVNKFRGECWVLSNFYEHPIKFRGITYRNTEACFQAQKCTTDEERMMFINLTGAEAKKLGRKVKMDITEWESIKLGIMLSIIQAKYEQCELFRDTLSQCEDCDVVEGNDHGDTYWGVDAKTGKGDNHLGKIMMYVRDMYTRRNIHDNNKICVRRVETPIDTIKERATKGMYEYDIPSHINMNLADLLLNPNTSTYFRIVLMVEPGTNKYKVVEGSDIIATIVKIGADAFESISSYIDVYFINEVTYKLFKEKGIKF